MKKNKKSTNIEKKNKSIKTVDNNYRREVFKVLRVLIIVLVVFGLFYLLTLYLTNKSSSSSSSSTSSSTKDETSISYQEIMAGSSFNQSGEYLVLYYDESDSDLKSTFTSMVSSYKEKDNHLTVYVVDMSSALNKKYSSDDSNNNPSSINDLKINGSTLIKFNDGSVSEYIEGQDSISSYLN